MNTNKTKKTKIKKRYSAPLHLFLSIVLFLIRVYSWLKMVLLSLQLFFFGDDLLHDLRSACPNGAEADVAPHATDRILGGIGEATHDLHAVVSNSLRQVRGIQLGHSNFLDGALAAVHQINCVVDEPASGFYGGEMLGEAVLPH